MHIVFLNIYPGGTMARYLLSTYVLRAFLWEHFKSPEKFRTTVINMGEKAPIERIVDKVTAAEPDVIGYSCYLWNIYQVEQVIKGLVKRTKACHVLGGPEISPTSIARLAGRGVGDFYISGEGEEPFKFLVESIYRDREGASSNLPAGVSARLGTDVLNGPSPNQLDLATVPSVYLTGAMEPVHYSGQQAYLETQRGCRNKCAYCVYHKSLPKIQYFPIKRIENELDYLILVQNVKVLRIFDAVFTSDLERAKLLVRHLIDLKEVLNREGRKLPWIYWEFICSQADDEFIGLTSLLKYHDRIDNSGTIKEKNSPQLYTDFLLDYTVISCIGIQSFNQKSLHAVQRPAISAKRFEQFVDIVRKYNVVLKIDLIFGLPFETTDSFWQGVEKLLPLFINSDHILNIHRLQMLPGSDLENSARELGVHWDPERGHLVRSTTAMSSEEICHGSLLIAMFFRLINSPLRADFLRAHAESGLSARLLCELMLDTARSDPVTADSKVVIAEELDDIYWNDTVFHEIPSEWAKNQLRKIQKVL